nr:MAG TPA: hypothetical protein [Caudoviricetes sp.]
MKQIVTITGENLNIVTKNVEATAATCKKTKAQMRLEALKAAGVDVSRYFTLGDDQLVKIENGAAVPVDMDDATIDAVGKKIVEGGYVNNWKLFRRWVMSQMFHMLRDMEKDDKSFNEVLQHKGYEYQWRMLENELYAQVKMSEHGDLDNVGARNRWFNGDVASDMATDYISKLRKYVDDNLIYNVKKDKDGNEKKAYKHTCKGNPYVRLQNKDIFVADLEKKVFTPLREIANEMAAVPTYKQLYDAVHKFNKNRKHLEWNTKQADAFINAYKGSGSYYTMRNLIMFHGARFLKGGRKMSEAASLKELESKAKSYDAQGWKMLGVLKKLIKESGIDIQGKINEWKKSDDDKK